MLELQSLLSVKDDFVKAVENAASSWTTTFLATGLKDPLVLRKDMMKLFREYMSLKHPKGKQRGAFATSGSSIAVDGESI